MHGKKPTLALATAFAALFVGCEWTGSSDSDSWSNAYDAMNFSGTYRAVTTATDIGSSTSETTTTDGNTFYTTSQSGGSFVSGANTASGQAAHGNIVPGSFQASAGGYIWSDDGSGKLVFTNPNSGSSSSGDTTQNTVVQGEEGLTTESGKDTYSWSLKHANIIAGSVSVILNNTQYFKDNGSGGLTGVGLSGSGAINYQSGEISVVFGSEPTAGQKLTVSYTYNESGVSVVSSSLSGSGVIQYSSGAWSLQINPAISSAAAITLRYSYYAENSASTATYTSINTSSGNEVSALTVSQNGQNLSIRLNNGIVMSGKFTNVQQTGKVNQDTNAGYNTYNAQFQVQTTDSKLVGTLNYDLKTGYRMLNGTWTWGKNSYDVQAVGPAWLNSADQSTLSPGVITK